MQLKMRGQHKWEKHQERINKKMNRKIRRKTKAIRNNKEQSSEEEANRRYRRKWRQRSFGKESHENTANNEKVQMGGKETKQNREWTEKPREKRKINGKSEWRFTKQLNIVQGKSWNMKYV